MSVTMSISLIRQRPTAEPVPVVAVRARGRPTVLVEHPGASAVSSPVAKIAEEVGSALAVILQLGNVPRRPRRGGRERRSSVGRHSIVDGRGAGPARLFGSDPAVGYEDGAIRVD